MQHTDIVDKNEKKILGSSFLPPLANAEGDIEKSLKNIQLDLIDPNPEQPRSIFKKEELEELAQSIKENGLIQPIIVTFQKSLGRFTLLAGERRLRAAKLAGLKHIPALVKEFARGEWLGLALVENIQRADLNCIEEARAYQSLIRDYGLTQERCAQKVGKDRASVANFLRLLKLPRAIQEDLTSGRLSVGHGKALMMIEGEEKKLEIRDQIIKRELTVRESEKLCLGFVRQDQKQKIKSDNHLMEADVEYLSALLRSALKTKVRLLGSKHKGRIEISYFSADELERLTLLLKNH